MIQPPLVRFDDQRFRASSWGALMTNPRGKSALEVYNEKRAELNTIKVKYEIDLKEAQEVRDAIEDKSLKKWKDADAKCTKLTDTFIAKKKALNDDIAEAALTKDVPHLSDTCIKALLKIYIEATSGRRDDIETRYMKKGTEGEDNSIDLLGECDNKKYFKNTVRMTDDPDFEGECDVIDDTNTDDLPSFILKYFPNGLPPNTVFRIINDTKSSWDEQTHKAKLIEDTDKGYVYQGEVYCVLYKGNFYNICYTLINTPEGIIADEEKRLLYKMGSDKIDSEAYRLGCEELRFNMTFDDMLPQERVIRKSFVPNPDTVRQMREKAPALRQWLNNFALSEYKRVQRELIHTYGEDFYILNNPDAIIYPEDDVVIAEAKDEEQTNTVININIGAINVNAQSTEKVQEAVTQVLTQAVNDASVVVGDDAPVINAVVASAPPSQPVASVPPQPIQQPVAQQATDDIPEHIKPYLEKIETLQSFEACVDYFREIKTVFDAEPIVKEKLTAKRISYEKKVVIPEKTAAAPPPQPTASVPPQPVSAPPAQPVVASAPPPQPVVIADAANADNETEALRIKALIDAAKTELEIRELFTAHKDFIKKEENKDLYQHMLNRGVIISGKKAKPTTK